MKLKFCNDCNESKSTSEFHKRSASKDGLLAYCKDCFSIRNKNYYAKHNVQILAKCKERYRNNKSQILERNKRYYLANKEKCVKQSRSWALSNPEKVRASLGRWRAKNPERTLQIARDWQKANRDKKAYWVAKRRAALKQRTPRWLNEGHFAEIKALYRKASEISKLTGIKHHVDHVVPVNGASVSGLHVAWNLRVITAEENLKKRDKLISEEVC